MNTYNVSHMGDDLVFRNLAICEKDLLDFLGYDRIVLLVEGIDRISVDGFGGHDGLEMGAEGFRVASSVC